MNRIVTMVLNNLIYVPGAWIKLCRYAKKVVAIELDTTLKPILAETMADYDNLESKIFAYSPALSQLWNGTVVPSQAYAEGGAHASFAFACRKACSYDAQDKGGEG